MSVSFGAMSVVLLKFKRTGWYYYEVFDILELQYCNWDGGYVRGCRFCVDYIVHPWQECMFFPLLSSMGMMLMSVLL